MPSNKEKPKVGIILINYNGLELTRDCVDSILSSTFNNWRILVIDNASSDGSSLALRGEFASVATVILSERNTGTSGANNLGLHWAFSHGCDYALILNNDTVLPKNSLSELIEHADSEGVTVPSIAFYSEPTRAWYAGGHFDVFGTARHEGKGDLIDTRSGDRYVSYAPTCCFLISKNAYNKVGLFDETYFMYWEDVDYCIRLNREGVKIKYVPSAVILHKVSASSGGEGNPLSGYYSIRNRLYGIDRLRLGIRPWLWARCALIKAFLSHRDEYKYARRAWEDYKAGLMGSVELNEH